MESRPPGAAGWLADLAGSGDEGGHVPCDEVPPLCLVEGGPEHLADIRDCLSIEAFTEFLVEHRLDVLRLEPTEPDVADGRLNVSANFRPVTLVTKRPDVRLGGVLE